MMERSLRIGLFVATVLTASAALAEGQVAVVTRTIYPGEKITSDMVEEVMLRPGQVAPRAVAITVEDLEGKVTKRTLLPRRYVPLAALREVWLVERGRQVLMVLIHGPLTITAAGVPLESGAAGDHIRVRNLDSGRIVSGTVMADGTVRIGAS
jgi:flagella basal body P-ring formation protein FlgA